MAYSFLCTCLLNACWSSSLYSRRPPPCLLPDASIVRNEIVQFFFLLTWRLTCEIYNHRVHVSATKLEKDYVSETLLL
uniref:Secreted protein n=1 Tax=Oryza brachyantha TaxID=4533 RepID=J3L4W0_ORYBR